MKKWVQQSKAVALALLLLGASYSNGQSPGGVAPAAWYRADAPSLFTNAGTTPVTDNSQVYQWNSEVGDFPLLQASSTRRPVYSVTTHANFHPTVTFDGSNDYMEFTAGTGVNIIDRANGSILTAGYIGRLKRSGFAGFHATMDYPGLHVYSNYRLLFFTAGGPGYQGVSTDLMTANSYFTAGSAWQNGSGSYLGATVTLNGTRITYLDNPGKMYNVNTSNTSRNFRIGSDSNYGAFEGQLNEILIFEDPLTEDELDKVETYLAIKYGSTYAKGGRDYKNSSGNTVWSASANAGFHYNIAGIGRDVAGALYQKQSWSTNPGDQILIGVGGLANTNADNSGTLSDGQFLIWGDNNAAKVPTVSTTDFSGVTHHFAAIWKVQNTGGVGTVRVAWPKSFDNLAIIQSSDPVIGAGDAVTPMSGEITINGLVYNYADVTLADGSYFTLAAKLSGPGGVTAGLLMWHKADDGTTTPGPKTVWRDVSGLGRDVTQNNRAGYQPTLVTNATYAADKKNYSFNFNPFYYFDGSNDFFYREGDLYFPTINSPGSAYGVIMNSDRNGWHTPYGWADDDPNFVRLSDRYEFWRDNGRPLYTTGLDARKMPANIAGMAWRGTSLNGVYLNIDGQIFSSTSTHIGTVNNNRNPANFAIGSEGYDVKGNGNEQFQGGIAEVFAYSVDHQNSGGDEMQRINSYLAIKYGITLKNAAGTGVSNYLASNSEIVWDVAANDGYNHNIAGIARDGSSALHQKQSMSNQAGLQVLIGTTGLANTNALNNVGLSEGQYLIWGDNGGAKALSIAFGNDNIANLNLRFGAIWKVQNTNSVGTVRVAWPAGVPNIHLIQSEDEEFDETDDRVDMSANLITVNGVAYNYADVTLDNGEYFTFAGYAVGPGGVGGAVVWLQANSGTSTSVDSEPVESWANIGSSGGLAVPWTANGYNPPYFKNGVHNFNPAIIDETTIAHGALLLQNVFPENAHRDLYSFVLQSQPNATQQRTLMAYGTNPTPSGAREAPWLSNNARRLHFFWEHAYENSYNTALPNDVVRIGGVPSINAYYLPMWTGTNPHITTLSLNGLTYTTEGNARADRPVGSHLYINADAGNNNNSGGNISEIISYSRQLTEAEINRVNSYLAIKYGITLLKSDGTLGADYVSSLGTTVWDAEANEGYNHNIAGIARDDYGSLSQKQSMSVNLGNHVLISTTGLADNNAANSVLLNDGQYLMWGDNNESRGLSVPVSGISGVNYRLAAVWKVQNTGNVGTVRVAWRKGFTNLKLLVSDSDDFTSPVVTDMSATQMVNGVEYAYADVTLEDGQYFTFAAMIYGPGGVTENLAYWYRGDMALESDGHETPAYRWTDIVAGATTYQLEGNALPMYYKGDATNLNFNPSLHFTANNQTLGNISISTLNGTQFDIFSVTGPQSHSGRFFNIGRNNTVRSGDNWDSPGLYGNGNIARRNSTGTLNNILISPGFITTQPNMMYYSFTETTTSKGLNGSAVATATHPEKDAVTGGHIFGANSGDGTGGDDVGYVGKLGELILYSNNIPDEDRQKVESYLAIKYGVTMQNSRDYVNSQGVVVWSAAANTGFYNNVAGIGRDDLSLFHQKQSRSQNTNSNNQVIIGIGDIAESNPENLNELNNGQYLVWGDNGITQAMTNSTSTYVALNYAGSTDNGRRMRRIWKVNNTNGVGEVKVRVAKATVGTTTFPVADVCADYVLITASDADFTENVEVVTLAEFQAEGDETANYYDGIVTFPAGPSFFTFGKVKPWNQGIVYLPSETESSRNFDNTCDIGEIKYFRSETDNSLKLIGMVGYSTTELSNLEVVINPEGVEYEDGSRFTRVMPRVTTVLDENTDPLSNGKVRIYYSQEELDATTVPDEKSSGWFKYDGDADEVAIDVFSDGLFDPTKVVALVPSATGVEDGVPYVEFSNINSFSSFIYISTSESSPLPVKLVDFSVRAEGDLAVLSWSTTNEFENRGFEILRSSDARTWTSIGFVEAGEGESNQYRFVDEMPIRGMSYYRLKQIDLNGREELSHVVSLKLQALKGMLSVYPNPASEGYVEFEMTRADAVSVKVLNMLGVELPVSRSGNRLNVKGLPAGQYILQIRTADGESYTKTFLIN